MSLTESGRMRRLLLWELAAVAVASIAVAIYLISVAEEFNSSSASTILGVIAASMATVLGIGFTIALVAGQIAAQRNLKLVSSTTGSFTILYAGLLVAAFVTALVSIAFTESSTATLYLFGRIQSFWLTVLSILLSVIALLLLLPFLTWLNRRLLPSYQFKAIQEQIFGAPTEEFTTRVRDLFA